MTLNLNNARFVTAAHKPSQWVQDHGCEVAFAGRSNSGKSTALNAIVGHRRLAITSKTPGRTQQIVFFQIDPEHRLIDLPGYGYAKVPPEVQRHWAGVIERFLTTRRSLQAMILTMDIRHPLKQLDTQLLNWCIESAVDVHILLTKADKLSKSKQANAKRTVEDEFKGVSGVSVQVFSGRTGLGVEQARARVISLLRNDSTG
ncbi:MAG: ribosome biogenesis GTP-binding protein YihA/YsxC [Acidiferrobacterales bacterium]|nr:ribosome biogenesis GTP-binding protein YihA/YsxC [Acidiferrobacterales bacterium]